MPIRGNDNVGNKVIMSFQNLLRASIFRLIAGQIPDDDGLIYWNAMRFVRDIMDPSKMYLAMLLREGLGSQMRQQWLKEGDTQNGVRYTDIALYTYQ